MRSCKSISEAIHFNTLLSGYFLSGEWEKGNDIFQNMVKRNLVDANTYLVVVQALSISGLRLSFPPSKTKKYLRKFSNNSKLDKKGEV